MFGNNTAQSKPDQDTISTKRDNFRLEIRSRQIQQIKRQTRRMHIEKIDQADYALLRNINLTDLLKNLKSFGAEEETIHKIFLYASSGGSDHMFEMFDDRIISILIDNLLIRGQYKMHWNRKIFRILTNYTLFSNVLNWDYILKISIITDILFQQETQSSINYSDETERNIVISMSRYFEKAESCRDILKNETHLFYKIIQRFWNRNPSLAQLSLKSDRSLPSLVIFHCEMIHNLYSNLQHSQINEDDQMNILRQIKKILTSFPTDSPLRQDQSKLVMIILDALAKLFGHSLDSHPELIINYQKYFFKLAAWFDHFRTNQKQSAKYRDIVVEYLRLIKVIYGPNIPSQISSQVIEFYKQFFQSHVGAIADKLLRQPDTLLQNYTLLMMQSILMETQMALFIIDQYSPLLSVIFIGIQAFPFTLKKQALICAINVLKSGVANNEENSAFEIVQLFSTNGIADLLAMYLYEYVDEDLNLEIIQGIHILLDVENNQYQAKNDFWRKFTEAGGVLKMQKILGESNSVPLKSEVANIFQKARNHENY